MDEKGGGGGGEESGFVPEHSTPPSPILHYNHHLSSIFPNDNQGQSVSDPGCNPSSNAELIQPHLQTTIEQNITQPTIDPESVTVSTDSFKQPQTQATTTTLALHESQSLLPDIKPVFDIKPTPDIKPLSDIKPGSGQPDLHEATSATAVHKVRPVIDPSRNPSGVIKLEQPPLQVPPPAAVYKCPHCPYQSSYRTNVNTHVRRHTGERPYTCCYCDYNSSYKSNMNRHIQRHFSENS